MMTFARINSIQATEVGERFLRISKVRAERLGNREAQNKLEWILDMITWAAMPAIALCAICPGPVVALAGLQSSLSKGQTL